MNLTDEQKEILKHTKENIYVSSAPGSGKSSMLSLLCREILKEPNAKVMLITFTNKASRSIIDKCSSEDQRRIIGGTFHSIAHRMLQYAGRQYTIIDEGKQRLLVKKLFDCKRDREKFETILGDVSLAKSEWPVRENAVVHKYNLELQKYNLYDFDDLIINAIELLTKQRVPTYECTHILVDELQDTNSPQLELLKRLHYYGSPTIAGVADDDQCQPGSTRVLTTTGYKRIDELNPTIDRLVSFISKGSYIGGLKNGYSFDITNRIYSGTLYTLTCDGKTAMCTSNHKWLVRWATEAKEKNVVYLMKRGNNYRIGWCQLFNSEGCLHLGTRARLEKADATWILKVTNDKRMASIYESIYAARYGIPTITFEPRDNSYYDSEAILKIFSELSNDLEKKAEILLKNFNLNKDYPFWTKEIAYEKQGGTQRFKVRASNLLENLMEIPVHTKGKEFKWCAIDRIEKNGCVNLKVFSLDVHVREDSGPNSKTYIVNDGMVTSNCLYLWRNANPENIQEFITYFKCKILNLGYNFRSVANIVNASKNLIENNKKRIVKTIRPFKSDLGTIVCHPCMDFLHEIDKIANTCLKHPGKEIAILYRNRSYKNHLEFQLRRNGIEYKINDFLDITDRTAVRCIISGLRVASGNFDIYDLRNLSKGIKGIGEKTVDLIEKQNRDVVLVVNEMLKDKRYTKRLGNVQRLFNFFTDNLSKPLSELVLLFDDLLKDSFSSASYPTDMRNFLIDITKELKINVSDIRSLANDLGLDGKKEVDNKDAKVELSTVHGFKGLEKDIVIVPFIQTYLDYSKDKIVIEEDERRVFYVAITRAKNNLYLTYSGQRPKFVKELLL